MTPSTHNALMTPTPSNMRLFFLNNIPIHIIKYSSLWNIGQVYDQVLTYQPSIASHFVAGHILIQVKSTQWKQFLNEVSKIAINKPKSISLLLHDTVDFNTLLQKYFTIARSAGGIVTKGKSILMIYRANIWDLPKGRIEQDELPIAAAEREVYEECNVKALAKEEFYTTWHGFQVNHSNILKETTWYIMKCLDDTYMAPQKEEAIERVEWVDLAQIQSIMENTYTSIRLLLQAYLNYIQLKES